MTTARRRLETSPASAGAIALIRLTGDIDDALSRLGIAPVRVGQIALRDLAGVDEGIVARWSEETAHLMPHAGPAVVRSLLRRLTERGIPEEDGPTPPEVRFPEARDTIEARMLDVLARAASPLAIDLLLDQPRRWEEARCRRSPGVGNEETGEGCERDRVLGRLIDPPLVVAVGPPNVGKSTLMNALAGREVAVVDDQAGTTRDHVGVLLDLGGLVVRYVDTPGLRVTQGVEAEAQAIASDLLREAELILACGDHIQAASASVGVESGAGGASVVRVALRSDLGRGDWAGDARVSALSGEGMDGLVRLVREVLVPEETMRDPRPWRFWDPATRVEAGKEE